MDRGILTAVLCGSLFLAGCGGSSETGPGAEATAKAAEDGPGAAVQEFLEAVRAGDDVRSAAMLTSIARQKTEEHGMQVAPPGSDTATFEVTEIEMLAEDSAHVGCRWTDMDENGEPRTDNIVWMLRREPEGWRVAGFAARLFDGEPPFFFDFEDPEDVERKQQLVLEKLQQRAAGLAPQAQTPAAETPATRR